MIRTRFSPLSLLLTCPQLSGCQHGGQDARHDMNEDKNVKGSDASDPSVPFLFPCYGLFSERNRDSKGIECKNKVYEVFKAFMRVRGCEWRVPLISCSACS